MKSKKRILVAPLNWGIGHATRCIPIIENLIKNDFDVLIATSGRPLQLLQEEFPHIKSIKFEDYNIKYSSYLPMSINILIQIPVDKELLQRHLLSNSFDPFTRKPLNMTQIRSYNNIPKIQRELSLWSEKLNIWKSTVTK